MRTAPTLLTSTSSRPCSSIASRTNCADPSRTDRSTATGVTPLRLFRLSVFSEPATTRAPSAARALVTARPIPLPAPVTTATFPSKFRSMVSSSLLRLDEALDKRKRRRGDFLPAAVDRERVPAAGNLSDLGDALVALVPLEGGVGYRPGNRVILLAGDQQQRSAVRVLRVDLRLGPRVEVGRRGLEERQAGRGNGEFLVQLLRLLFADRVGEGVAELVICQRDRAVPVRRVAERRRRGPQRRDWQRQHAAEWRRVDRHGHRRQAPAGQDLGEQSAERVPDDNRFPGQHPGDLGEVVGDLPDRLAREYLRVGVGLCRRLRIVWPARRKRRVTGGLK